MKKLLFLLPLWGSVLLTAQVKYENGYLISNDGTKKNVLINNKIPIKNIEKTVYKNGQSDSEKAIPFQEIKEFGIIDGMQFIKYFGKVETSPDNIHELSVNPNFIWQEKEVFLRLLVSGQYNLYGLNTDQNERFFYSDANGTIIPLNYKMYNEDGDVYKITEKLEYKSQLRKLFKDNPKVLASIENSLHTENELTRLFQRYNNVSKKELINPKSTRSIIALNIRPGINLTTLNFNPNNRSMEVDFSTKAIFRIGLELEAFLPFLNNKWSFLLEPLYYSYSTDNTSKNEQVKYNAKYAGLDLGIGARHYMYLNNDSAIFLNGGANMKLYKSHESGIYYQHVFPVMTGGKQSNSNSVYLSFGAGYKYKKKYSIEARYNTGRDIFESSDWTSSLSSFSFILGYSLF